MTENDVKLKYANYITIWISIWALVVSFAIGYWLMSPWAAIIAFGLFNVFDSWVRIGAIAKS